MMVSEGGGVEGKENFFKVISDPGTWRSRGL